jgi:hypothetical protein
VRFAGLGHQQSVLARSMASLSDFVILTKDPKRLGPCTSDTLSLYQQSTPGTFL